MVQSKEITLYVKMFIALLLMIVKKRLDQPSLQKQKRGMVKKTKKYIYTYVRKYYSAVI